MRRILYVLLLCLFLGTVASAEDVSDFLRFPPLSSAPKKVDKKGTIYYDGTALQCLNGLGSYQPFCGIDVPTAVPTVTPTVTRTPTPTATFNTPTPTRTFREGCILVGCDFSNLRVTIPDLEGNVPGYVLPSWINSGRYRLLVQGFGAGSGPNMGIVNYSTAPTLEFVASGGTYAAPAETTAGLVELMKAFAIDADGLDVGAGGIAFELLRDPIEGTGTPSDFIVSIGGPGGNVHGGMRVTDDSWAVLGYHDPEHESAIAPLTVGASVSAGAPHDEPGVIAQAEWHMATPQPTANVNHGKTFVGDDECYYFLSQSGVLEAINPSCEPATPTPVNTPGNTVTPIPTSTPANTPTVTPTFTAIPPPPTAFPCGVDVCAPTATRTATFTETPVFTPVPTQTRRPECFHVGGRVTLSATITTTAIYQAWDGSISAGATESFNDFGVVHAGFCRSLRLDINSALIPGTSESIDVTLRKGAADTALTCSIVPAAPGECTIDLGASPVTFVAGDDLDWKIVCSGAGCPTDSVGIYTLSAECCWTY